MTEHHVQLDARVRPLNKVEEHKRQRQIVEIDDSHVIVEDYDPVPVTPVDFSQRLQRLVDGYNQTILIYGGQDAHLVTKECVKNLGDGIFKQLQFTTTIKCSIVEIHSQRIRDLLHETSGYVHKHELHGVSQCSIIDFNDIKELFNFALSKRVRTNQSTLLFQIILEQYDHKETCRKSVLQIYQLPGDATALQPLHEQVQHRIQQVDSVLPNFTNGPPLVQLLAPSWYTHDTTVILTLAPCEIHTTLEIVRFGQSLTKIQLKPTQHQQEVWQDSFQQIQELQQRQEHLEQLVKTLAHECVKLKEKPNAYQRPDLKDAIENIVSSTEKSTSLSFSVDSPSEQIRKMEEFRLKSDLKKAVQDKEELKQQLAAKESDMEILRQELEERSNKSNSQAELINARNEAELWKQKKAEVEHNLRTSQFREAEAVVLLRQFRRFYARVLHKTGFTSIEGAPNLRELVDMDKMMVLNGLLEPHEVAKDADPANYRPSREALIRSTTEAEKALHLEEDITANGNNNDEDGGENVEFLHATPPLPKSIVERESAELVEARQRLYKTPAGRYIEMREQQLEKELLEMTDKLKEVQKMYESEKANFEAINKTGITAAFDKVRAAQETKHLKDQLERKNQDLQAVVLKWNEFHAVRQTLVEKMTAREQHIAYLEENLSTLGSQNAIILSDREQAEKKLQEEIKTLKNQMKRLSDPIWLLAEDQEGKKPSLSRRLVLPFNMVEDSLDKKREDREKLSALEEILKEEAESATHTSSVIRVAQGVDASVQTDPDRSVYAPSDANEPFNIEDQLFMAGPSSTDVSKSFYSDIVDVYDSFSTSMGPEQLNKSANALEANNAKEDSDPTSPAPSSRQVFRYQSSPEKVETSVFRPAWGSSNRTSATSIPAASPLTTSQDDSKEDIDVRQSNENGASPTTPTSNKKTVEVESTVPVESKGWVSPRSRRASTGSLSSPGAKSNDQGLKPTKKGSSFMSRIKAQAAKKAVQEADSSEPEWLRKFQKIGAKNQGESVIETSGAAEAKDLYAVRTEMGEALKKKNSNDLTALTVSAQSSAPSTWTPRTKDKDESEGGDDFAKDFLGQTNTGMQPADSDSESEHVDATGDEKKEADDSSSSSHDQMPLKATPKNDSSSSGDEGEAPKANPVSTTTKDDSDSDSEDSAPKIPAKKPVTDDSDSDSDDSKKKAQAPATIEKKKSFLDDSDSDSEGSNDKKTPAPAPAPIAKKKSFLDDSDSDSEDEKPASTASSVPPPSSNPSTEKKSMLNDSDSESEDEKPAPQALKSSLDDSDSDSENSKNEAQKASATPPAPASKKSFLDDSDSEDESAPAAAPAPAPSPPKKASLDSDSESDSEDETPTPAAAPAPAKKSFLDSDSEGDSEDEKAKAASTPAPAPIKKQDSDSDSEDSEDEKPKPAPAPAPAKKSALDDSDSESEDEKPKQAPVPAPAPAKKSALDDSDSESESSEEKKPTPAQAPAPAKKSALDDSDSDSESSEEKKKPAPAPTPAKKSAFNDSDSDSESSEEKKKPAPPPARAPAPAKKSADSDSESDESEEESPRPAKKSLSMLAKSPKAEKEDDPWATTHTRNSLGPADQEDLIASPKKASKAMASIGSPRRSVPDFGSEVSSASPKKKKKEKSKAKFVIKDGKLVKSDEDEEVKSPKKSKKSKKEAAPAFEIVNGKLVKKKKDRKKKK